MGGRGSSSGFSVSGKRYGTEYTTAYQSGNIKFVISNSGSAKTPMETMTHGRIYATLSNRKDGGQEVKAITYYDKNNKRYKQIDVIGNAHYIGGKPELPHTHRGYLHDENGTRKLTEKERKMVERVLVTWYNHTRAK
jgi:hypothetical protein